MLIAFPGSLSGSWPAGFEVVSEPGPRAGDGISCERPEACEESDDAEALRLWRLLKVRFLDEEKNDGRPPPETTGRVASR